MVDAGIGRLLLASLHQGIGDLLPNRLEFYENWLTAKGMRDGRIGLASLSAVLSFLRREGQPTYDAVMGRAGAYAAEWTVGELSGFEKALIRTLPTRLRAAAALRITRRLVRATCTTSKTKVRTRRGTGTIDIRASIFCSLREAAAAPMCGYYAAAAEALLAAFLIEAEAHVTQCRAAGAAGCSVVVTVRGARAHAPAAEAA